MNYSKLPPHLRTSSKQQQQQQQQQQQRSALVGDMTTKAVHVEPRSNSSSSAHSHNIIGSTTSPWSGKPSVSLGSNLAGPSVVKPTSEAWYGSAGQASSSRVPAIKQQLAPISNWNKYAGEASSSKLSNVKQQQQQTPQPSLQNIPPPHLRGKPAATTQVPGSTPSMNAGKLAKSAKHDSKVPCTYKDCTRGFTKETDMCRHKDEDHDWCRLCNVDCEDDLALLQHKVDSDRHICCDVCGEDFRSETGKERHMRLNHATMQQVECPACHYIFERGAGLIDHIYNNKCRDRRGFIAEKVNQNTLLEYRAAAALHLDAISNKPSTIAAEIAAMQPLSERGTSFVDNSEGGVRVNLLDDDTPYGQPYGHLTARSLSRAEQSDLSDVESTAASNGTERAILDEDIPELPAHFGDMSKASAQGESVIEGLQALQMGSSNAGVPEKQPWASKFFPGAKPTPVTPGWMAPTSSPRPGFKRNILPSDAGSEHRIRTDWDNLALERDVDDMYHCPFTKCVESYYELSQLKSHLASGYHQGTDHRCLKCLKVFKSPAALTAHMESSSERCKIRESTAYGHVLHVVSGGFLKVTGRHADGSIKVEAPTMEEIEEQMRSEALPPHLDEDYPW